jgi:small subunit ribosomal protein S20
VANIQSQIKRNRQNEKRRALNRTVRSRLRTTLKKFDAAVDAGDRAEAETAYRAATRELDRAATKGVIHRNKANNKKSRLAKRLTSV